MMPSLLSKAVVANPFGSRPPAAVEISPEGVVAAALAAHSHTRTYAYQALPAGAVVPGIAEANLRDPAAVTAAIRSALAAVSPRKRAVTLVIPDPAVRVFMLDFDTLPGKSAEALPVIRFRLRKMAPFDVEHAGLSYQVLSENQTGCKVLAAIVPGAVLQEYESAALAAGYEAGAVLPSTLAALAGVNSLEAVLTAHLSGLSLTTSIASGDDLLLYRTLDLPEDETHRLEEVRRGVAVAAAYFEDQLHARPARLLFSGSGGAERFGGWLNHPELPVEDMAPRPETGAATSLGEASVAAVAGALVEAG